MASAASAYSLFANTTVERAGQEETDRNIEVWRTMCVVLDSGELLTDTPTVTEVTTSELTISNVVVSTAELTINGAAVAVGEAVQFKVIGQLAGTGSYKLLITAVTDSMPARTLKKWVEFNTVSSE